MSEQQQRSDGITIRPLDDLAAMRRLGVACGLEDEGRDDEGILAAWGAWDGERLVGAICLERQSDLDTVNWMSVDEEYRRRGIAAALYAELEREALARVACAGCGSRRGLRGSSSPRASSPSPAAPSATPCSAAASLAPSSAASAGRRR